jgi:hypothetical protein
MSNAAREWFGSFRSSFPDVRMEIVVPVEEGDTVVGRFLCSATHSGEWRGHAPTGRRFEDIEAARPPARLVVVNFGDGVGGSAPGTSSCEASEPVLDSATETRY